MHFHKTTALTLALAFSLTTFNSAFAADPAPGVVEVSAAMRYPDGSILKARPTEVQLVKAEQMQKSVAGKVALGVLLFAMGGGTGFTTSSKDNMVGSTIDGLQDRSNLQIADPAEFANRLQTSVQAAIQANAEWSAKTFKRGVLVAGGVSNLVYEGLTGEDAERYRLKTDWVVYKAKESFSLFGGSQVTVDCSAQSAEPLPQTTWAENNYAKVKTELDANMQTCEQKVLAALPDLLKD
jgi:outer membrane lipoprotein SlyB